MPYAGFSDLRGLAYVFIPRYFYPDKPILMDGNEIVIGYTGIRIIGTSSVVSLMADLYRRGGTVAVIFGGLVSSLVLFFYLTLALFITRSLIIGIDYAHSKGVSLLDIKPLNILVCGDLNLDNWEFWIKLCDFGMSKKTEGPFNSKQGTPEYMSP